MYSHVLQDFTDVTLTGGDDSIEQGQPISSFDLYEGLKTLLQRIGSFESIYPPVLYENYVLTNASTRT